MVSSNDRRWERLTRCGRAIGSVGMGHGLLLAATDQAGRHSVLLQQRAGGSYGGSGDCQAGRETVMNRWCAALREAIEECAIDPRPVVYRRQQRRPRWLDVPDRAGEHRSAAGRYGGQRRDQRGRVGAGCRRRAAPAAPGLRWPVACAADGTYPADDRCRRRERRGLPARRLVAGPGRGSAASDRGDQRAGDGRSREPS
jgi:hypothetical protein